MEIANILIEHSKSESNLTGRYLETLRLDVFEHTFPEEQLAIYIEEYWQISQTVHFRPFDVPDGMDANFQVVAYFEMWFIRGRQFFFEK